jgi:hypothetical protein
MKKTSSKSSLEWAQKASYNMRTEKWSLFHRIYLHILATKSFFLWHTGLVYVEK